MILLNSTSDLIKVVTAAAGAINIHASYIDINGTTVTPGRANTASITTATTTTVVASPAASTTRNLKHLSIFNASLTIDQQVTVLHTDGTNELTIFTGLLKSLESLHYYDEAGWQKCNANGVLVSSSLEVDKTTYTATIANGASVSGVIDVGTDGFFGFIAPSAWTTATLSIEASVDNSTWVTTLYDANSIQTGFYSALTASAYYQVDFQALLAFRYFRLRSGSSASPVNQAADRVFTCVSRPVA